MSMNPVTSAGDLKSLFNPRSIVFIGAGNRSLWSSTAIANLKALGFTGELHLVSRGWGMVHGQQTLKSCTAIGKPVDVALVLVPPNAVLDVIRDIGAAGIRNVVTLAGGFSELGGEGAKLQDQVLAMARGLGILVLGPNCLGFINFITGAACWSASMRTPALAGVIGIVSQSGAVANYIAHFSHQHSVGLSCVVSTGNEPSVNLAGVINYLVDDPGTRVIALFVETVRDPSGFGRAARRALDCGKPIVVLKIGRSEITAKAARSHTGSVVGDDKVFDGVSQQLGLARVDSIEELVFTADLMAKTGPLEGGGVGLVSISGGICELAADAAHSDSVALPELATETISALRAVLPSFATSGNPLDVTGGAISDPELFEKTLSVMSQDSSLSLIACLFDVPTGADNDWSPPDVAAVKSIGRYMAKNAAIPTIVISHTVKVVSGKSRDRGEPFLRAGWYENGGARDSERHRLVVQVPAGAPRAAKPRVRRAAKRIARF